MIITAAASLTLRLRARKRSFLLRHRLPICASALAALAVGCAAQKKVVQQRSYVLAARYEVPGSSMPWPQQEEQLHSHLERFRSMGFNAVLFDYVPDAQRKHFLNAAEKAQLRAYLTDSDIHYYLLTGRLRGADHLEALVRTRLGEISAHHSFAGLAIQGGYPRHRVAAVVAILDGQQIPYLIPGQGGYDHGQGLTVSWLDAVPLGNPKISPLERMTLEFNRELFSGWTDGLVVDFATSPAASAPQQTVAAASDQAAEEEFFEVPVSDRARIFAIDAVLRGARHWGPRLCGARRQAAALSREAHPALLSALFVREHRAYLLILNQSSESIRQTMRFATSVDTRTLSKAVEIPIEADKVAGAVFRARGSELPIDIVLRPGDAALFELF